MLVTINSVKITKEPKGYQVAEVAYAREGKDEARKVMSFASPNVFEFFGKNETYPIEVNVKMEKNAKGYWEWKAIETNTGASANASTQASGKPAGRVTGSNYETPEERAKRQVYIVRQSSISNAIAYYQALAPKGIEVDPQAIVALAKVFSNFVFEGNE